MRGEEIRVRCEAFEASKAAYLLSESEAGHRLAVPEVSSNTASLVPEAGTFTAAVPWSALSIRTLVSGSNARIRAGSAFLMAHTVPSSFSNAQHGLTLSGIYAITLMRPT